MIPECFQTSGIFCSSSILLNSAAIFVTKESLLPPNFIYSFVIPSYPGALYSFEICYYFDSFKNVGNYVNDFLSKTV